MLVQHTETQRFYAMKILDKQNDSKCPLCDISFNGDLSSHILAKHSLLENLSKSKRDYDRQKGVLNNLLKSYQEKINSFKNTKILENEIGYEDLAKKINFVEI